MILLRHGESETNAIRAATGENAEIRDPSLTDLGREQVHRRAKTLTSLPLTAIWSSPLTRALQTSEILAEHLGLPVTVTPLVAERCAWPSDIGTETSVLQGRWHRFTFHPMPEQWWPDGEEPVLSIRHRSRKFLTQTTTDDAWRQTLVVTHWGFIKAVAGTEVANAEIVRITESQIFSHMSDGA